MTTITLDDELIKQIVATTHENNAQKAVAKILSDYLQQQKQTTNIAKLLAMPDADEIDFNPPRLNTTLYKPADLS